MPKVPLLLLLLPLMGCGGVPYVEAELKYAFPFSSDYWVHQDRSWSCEPPQLDLEVGLEWENGWAGGVYHESFILCGTGNSKPEIYENGLLIKKKFGGIK